MPGICGIELTEKTRRIRPGLPVLVISGYAGDVLERQSPSEDVEFLPKPFAIRTLAQRLRGLLDNNR